MSRTNSARCERRKVARKLNELSRNPLVQQIVDDVSTNAFAAFVRNAFTNRPEDIDEKTWGMTVELVMKAGRGNDAPPAFEIRDLPPKDEQ